MENFGESAISRMEDDFSKVSTSLPEIIAEEEGTISTLIIIIVSAILSITLLFIMAVFIDCRHQKLDEIKKKSPKKKILRIPIPRIHRPTKQTSEDKETFADKMHTDDSTPSNDPSVIV